MKKKNNAFTLLELLIAIAITAIITLTIIYIFRIGFEAWQFGYGQAVCQSADEVALSKIVEGDYYYDGLREALDIVEAGNSEIGFLPWYVQEVNRINPAKEFELEKTLLRGSSVPICEVYDEEKKEFVYCPSEYFYIKEGDGYRDFVRFNSDKYYYKGRIIYYPDPRKEDDVVMKIYYDKNKKMVFREYRGKKVPLIRGNNNISNLKFEYYDNTNNKIDIKNLDLNRNIASPITAVSIFIESEAENEKYSLKSFVNLRRKGLAGNGIYLTENSTVRIPNSKEIKSLLITNLGGVSGPSEVIIDIYDEENKAQDYRVKIELENIKGMEYIKSYSVEYPKGEVVYNKNIMTPAVNGLNFLTLDSSGNYDYDDDEGLEDIVIFDGKKIIFKVEKMEIEGMTLFVK